MMEVMRTARVPELAHGKEHFFEFLDVVDSLDVNAARLAEELEGLGRAGDEPPPPLLRGGALDQLVEDVEVALALDLVHDARLLEQVVDRRGTADGALLIEVDLHPLTETRGVVVAQRFGVT